jgi:hypothetical protein
MCLPLLCSVWNWLVQYLLRGAQLTILHRIRRRRVGAHKSLSRLTNDDFPSFKYARFSEGRFDLVSKRLLYSKQA